MHLDRRKEKERQEQREDRKQAMQSMQAPISAQTQNQQVKPRKSIKYHKPEDLYEFEYDETDDDENGID